MRDLLSFVHPASACPYSQAANSNFPSSHALDATHATVPCTATSPFVQKTSSLTANTRQHQNVGTFSSGL
ncbi:hypothetical protein DVH24_015242 [Malus domestica]|uniref:Uncharacterized protein n=1 Tax=Malus domestica TaxID=3750 RepID=A0A498K8D0_MALDO|nr:hypothetical protein DVH24_015242 [Malus domestica]